MAQVLKKNISMTWYVLALTRIGLGLVFLWAFIDKLLGLGFATCRDVKTDTVTTFCSKAWIHGGSPTDGFLKFAAKGPFKSFYNGMAGNRLVAVLFMAGLLLIGLALVTGIGIRIAALSGSLLLIMMWAALLPPANNPILDDHIIYILILQAIMLANADQKLGFGAWWSKQPIVKRMPILQ